MTDDPVNRFSNRLILIYQETVDDFYGFVSRRSGGSRELAEDVTQETYLRATTAWRRNGIPDCPLAWLQSVARHLLVNHFRRRQPASIDASDVEAVLGRAASDGSEAAALVCWGITRLKVRHAALLEAFYMDGRTVRSLAEQYQLTERAVEGRLRRARLALRKILSPHVCAKGERL